MHRPLVGRDAEAAVLRGVVLDAFRTGRLHAAIVEGAPGMGVRALVATATAEAVAARATVAHVDAGAPSLPALPAGDAGPALVVVRDLHRAGVAGVEQLRAAVAAREASAVAVVLSTRDAASPPSAALVDELVVCGARLVHLGPLDDAAVRALAEHEVGAACGPTLRRALARAGGVPLAVVEVIDGLRREGRLVVHDGVADVETDDLPASVRERIVRPLEALPHETLDVLHVAAALAPHDVEIAELAMVLGRPVADVVSALAPLDAPGLVMRDGTRLRFRHVLLREALYDSLAPALRAAVQAEVATALAAAGAPPVRVAHHLVAAEGAAPPTLAADVAWAIRRDAPRLALDICRVTLAAGPSDDVRARVVVASVWPLVTQGELDEAEAIARDLLARRPFDDALTTELSWCLVAVLQRRGQAAAGLDELVALLDRPTVPPDERPYLLARLPVAHVLTGDAAAAEAIADGLLADPDLRDNPAIAVGARIPRAFGCLGRGDVPAAVAVADEIDALVRDRPPPSTEGLGLIRPSVLVEADRFEEARSALVDAARRDAEQGDPSVVSAYDVWLVVIDALSGAWEDAVAGGEAVLQVVHDDGGAAIVALYALGYPAVVHVRRGEVDVADELVTLAERALEERGPQNGADVVLWARSLVLDARGATDDAAALLAMEWDLTASVRYFHSWRSVAPDLVRLALATGDTGRARAVTEDAEEGGRRAGDVPSARGAALRCRGLLDGDPDVLVAAVEALRVGPRRPDTAGAAVDAGAALAAAGRRDEAVAALDLARAVAGSIGAWRDVRTIDARLASLGAGSRRVGRDRPTGGWEALTARESEVATLVADGLTNPQIAERLRLSRHTVESHVKRIFVKLDVSSRGQLAAEALRRGRRADRPNT